MDIMKEIISEVTGTVWQIVAPVGSKVVEGDVVVIVESMKMEIPICSPSGGVVSALYVGEGDAVEDHQSVGTVSP